LQDDNDGENANIKHGGNKLIKEGSLNAKKNDSEGELMRSPFEWNWIMASNGKWLSLHATILF
jgi:hypothetical protein